LANAVKHVNGNYYHLSLQFCLLLKKTPKKQHKVLFYIYFKLLISFLNIEYTKLHHSFK